MIASFFGGFDELIHNMFGRWYIRIPHTQINNILSFMPELHFKRINHTENVGRHPGHSSEFHHVPSLLKGKFSWVNDYHEWI